MLLLSYSISSGALDSQPWSSSIISCNIIIITHIHHTDIYSQTHNYTYIYNINAPAADAQKPDLASLGVLGGITKASAEK